MPGKLVRSGASQDFQTSFEQTFLVNTGVINATVPTTTTFTPYPVTVSATTFGADDIAAIDTEQWQKLRWMFQLYEKYKLTGVKITFRPRFTEQIGDGATTATTTTVNGTPTYTPGLEDTWQMKMMWDDEDVITRAQTSGTGLLNEYFQTDLQDGCVAFNSTQYGELYIKPKLQEEYAGIGFSGGGALNPNDGGQPAVLPDPSATLNYTEGSFTRPISAPWVPTKVLGLPTGSITTEAIVLNTFTNFFGFKIYAYNPYMSAFTYNSTNTINLINFPIGTLKFRYYWAFKDLDNRGLVTVGAGSLQAMSMVQLNEDDAVVTSFGAKARFISPLEKARDNKRKADQALLRENEEKNKIAKATESPAATSQTQPINTLTPRPK